MKMPLNKSTQTRRSLIVALTTTLLSLLLFSLPALAEIKSSGGDEFRKTAAKYTQKAKLHKDKGHHELAEVYQRMSEIKIDAAKLGDANRWDEIDWAEYHQLEGKIAGLKDYNQADKKLP